MASHTHSSRAGAMGGTDQRPELAASVTSRKDTAGKIDWPVTSIRSSVAVLLMTSAILKAFSPAESATLAAGYSIPPWFTATGVQLELLVAAVLVFGCWERWTLRLTIGLFAVFAAFSLYRAVAGFESCGCFGAIKVNPWLTFVLDLMVLGCLGFAARRASITRQEGGERKRVSRAAAAYMLAAPPILVLMLWTGPKKLEADSGFIEYGQLVILEPEQWIGREFPLSSYLSSEVDIAHGDWTLFVYHHDCPKCQEVIPRYLILADRYSMRDGGKRVLFVEVPPYGTALPNTRSVHYARLRDDREWFVQAPVEISLSDGIVSDASLTLPSIDVD